MTSLKQQLTRSLAEDGPVRAIPLHPTKVRAFRVSENGTTYAINEEWHSLEDALAGVVIVSALWHKETVLLREQGRRGVRMHVYKVKQKSRARYVHRDHVTRAVRDLYLEAVCSFDAGVMGL